MTSFFANSDPNAQTATKTRRTTALTAFETFAKTEFPQATLPQATTIPCFGSDTDEQQIAQSIFASPTVATTDSETLGDLGGIYTLQKILAEQGRVYDDSKLHLFVGANTFNQVYIEGSLTNPTSAIVLENKGGTSQLGSRTDKLTNTIVTQGTAAYFDVEVRLMMNAKGHSQKNSVGLALQMLRQKRPSKIAYAVVRTQYKRWGFKNPPKSKAKKKRAPRVVQKNLEIYNPVVEHTLIL